MTDAAEYIERDFKEAYIRMKERALDAEAKAGRLRTVLETILLIHAGNQPPALNMPDVDYARRVIRDIHFHARDALSRC